MAGSTRDMTKGSPLKLIVALGLPLMIGNVFQQMYTIVDTIVVGNALGASDWLNWIVLGIITGATQGFSILTAQRFGAGEMEGMRRAAALSITLTGVLALFLAIVSQCLAAPMLAVLETPAEILPDALIYLRVCYLGIPVIAAYNILASILRALGSGRAPLLAMAIAALINMGLDVLFVYGFGWGIAGAAAATVIAQFCSSLFCLTVILRIPSLAFAKRDFVPVRAEVKRLVRLGTPMAFQNGVIGAGGIFIQKIINGFGVIFIAGFTATNKLYGLLELAAISFGFSVATYTAQNLGAGRYRRIKQGIRSAVALSIAVSAVISLAMLLLGRNIVSLFINDEPGLKAQAVEIAFDYLKIMSYPLVILYFLHMYRSALQGMGDTIIPMCSGIMELVMRIVIILTLPQVLGYTGVYLAEPGAWLGAVVLLVAVYYIRMHRLMRSVPAEDAMAAEEG